MAWDLSDYNLSGPAALDEAKFTVLAKIPPNTSQQEFNVMLQGLLQKSVGLTVHHEQREQTVYDMEIARSGLKMREAESKPAAGPGDEEGAAPAHRLSRDNNGNQALPPGVPAIVRAALPGGLIRVMARAQGIERIHRFVQSEVGHQVTDRTGLTGEYDFVLDYAPDQPVPRGSAPAEPTSGPSFVSALAEQLGLRLKPRKGMVDLLVVDGFRKVPINN